MEIRRGAEVADEGLTGAAIGRGAGVGGAATGRAASMVWTKPCTAGRIEAANCVASV